MKIEFTAAGDESKIAELKLAMKKKKPPTRETRAGGYEDCTRRV